MNDETIGNSIFLVVSFFATSSFLLLLSLVFPTTTMTYLAVVGIVLLGGLLFFGLRREREKGKRSVLQDVAQKAGLVPIDQSYQKVVGDYCGREVTLELVTKADEEASLDYVHSTISIENPANLFLQLSEREAYFETALENENENEDEDEDEDVQFRARFSVNCKPHRLCEALFDVPDLQERLMAYHIEELTIRENQLSFKVLSGNYAYLQRLLDFLCDLRGQIDLILPLKY